MSHQLKPSTLSVLTGIFRESWWMRTASLQHYAMQSMALNERMESLDDIRFEDFFVLRPEARTDSAGIAHIHIRETLVNDGMLPAIYEKLGLVTFYGTVIRETMDEIGKGAKAVLFHIDSPGGTVSGCIEAAQFIAGITIPKAVYTRNVACSAAYKLAAGGGVIIASRSATVGNIGTIMKWADLTEFWSQMGVTFKALVSEGAELKSTFHLEPNETQVAFLQESVDEAGTSFRNHVATHRPQVDEEVWRAGWYDGDHALALGLIDVIGDEQDAVNALLQQIG